MINNVMFCPDVGGPCVKDRCVCFNNVIIMEINSRNSIVKKISDVTLCYNLPMTFSLNINGCSKYDKIVDSESEEIFEEFKREMMVDQIINKEGDNNE